MQSIRAFVCLPLLLASVAGAQTELLIPDSTSDTVGRYDAQTGAYLGDLINGAGTLSTPIEALVGPDGLIYVSDQVADAVFRYTAAGAFVDTFADSSDGLNNVRGIAFLGTDLLVSNAPTVATAAVLRFDSAGTRLADFATGVDPFDVLVDGQNVIVSDIGADNVKHYTAAGALVNTLFAIDFPQQSVKAPGGNYFNNSFNPSANDVNEFTLAGSVNSFAITGSGRGIGVLGNGNLIVVSGSGIYEYTTTGSLVTTLRTGTGFRYVNPLTTGGPPACYANCDGSTTTPVLNVADFTCFLQRYAAGESYANCDGSTTTPVLNVADFTCFLQSYAAGCP